MAVPEGYNAMPVAESAAHPMVQSHSGLVYNAPAAYEYYPAHPASYAPAPMYEMAAPAAPVAPAAPATPAPAYCSHGLPLSAPAAPESSEQESFQEYYQKEFDAPQNSADSGRQAAHSAEPARQPTYSAEPSRPAAA